MDEGLKQRLVGAAVLVLLAAIFVPMLLDPSPEPPDSGPETRVASSGEAGFNSRIIPLDEPRTVTPDEAARAQPDPDASVGVETGEAGGTGAAGGAVEGTEAQPAPDTGQARSQEPAAPELPGGDETQAAREGAGATAIEEGRTGDEAPAEWAVQLGSFSKRQNALVLRNRLRATGYAAFTQTVTSDRGEVIRVFVGPQPTRGHAVSIVEALRQETELEGIVVRYPRG